MTHWYGTWLIDIGHDSLIWDMTHWYGTWLIDMGHDSLIWDMTHLCHFRNIARSCAEGGSRLVPVQWFCPIFFLNPLIFKQNCAEMQRLVYGVCSCASVMCDMTQWYGTWLIDMGHDSLTWDMTHLCHFRNIACSCVSVICDMTHWHGTWLIDMGHDSFYVIYVDFRNVAHCCVSVICDMIHWCGTWLIDMGHDSFMSISEMQPASVSVHAFSILLNYPPSRNRHTFKFESVHVPMCVYVYICICVYIHVYTYICMWIYMCMCIYM